MSKEKPVLLQINVTANWGSTGKIAEQIGQMAIQQGWESYIAYGRRMNPSKSKVIRVGTTFDVYLHYAASRFLDAEGLASKLATKKLIKEIDRIKPDIIHLHNIHDHYLNYPLLFKYLAENNIPVVWTQHDQWATTGHCPYNQVGCEKWKSLCFDCPVKEKWSLDRSKRNYELKKRYFTAVKSMTVVSVSDWLNSQIEQSFLGVHPKKVVKNGVDIDVFKPVFTDIRNLYGLEGKKTILGVANPWSESKGLNDYIKLSELLPESILIVLVGLSEEQRKGLPSNIIGIGPTQNISELVSLYSMADIVMNLSYAETFGMTTAEGFACGTPSIVYNVTASPELVTSETGLVVEPGNIEGVAKAVKEMIVKGKNFFSKNCRKRAEEFFDKNNSFRAYIALYEELIANQ